jgi:hypothetical protein
MIPWFIVHLVGAIASLFSREVYVTAVHGDRWGVERIHFMPFVPSMPRPRRLAAWDGSPLAPGEPIDLMVPGDPTFTAAATLIAPPPGAPSCRVLHRTPPDLPGADPLPA